ncbi:MAG: GspE/PulE family protein [Patescibacteria group bacterium]|jgi:type IV pilus assembly protein PilB
MANDESKNSKSPRVGLQISTNEVQDKFDAKMAEIKLAEKEQETAKKAAASGFPYMDISRLAILPEAISVIGEDEAVTARVLCFDKKDDNVYFAAVDPMSAATQDLVRKYTSQDYKITLYMVSQHSFEKALYFYKTVPKFREVKLGVSIGEKDLERFRGQFTDFEDLANKIRKVTTTDLVIFIIAAAIDGRASDIHIEAEDEGIVIRFRIDGILHEIVKLPKDIWHKLDSRIKLLARMKLNVADKPQDGRFSIELTKEKIDVRVSALPTNFGASIVMRLLMSSAISINFDDLGLRGKAYADLDREIRKPNGMIITTGPTGSGKTTTLYAVLNRLNTPGNKIITLEDPIEYELEGVSQSQIDVASDYNFVKGLRAILRQDPNVIMVGEIRDLETAETAINAALTGHLVISTIHTNSAAATIPRFMAMNVKPFLLAPALNVMMGQRLVRRICEHCKVEAEIDNRTMSDIMKILSTLSPESGEHRAAISLDKLKFYKGAGCKECQGLGYKGRIGIYEIMSMTQEIEGLILSGQVSEYQMQEIAVKNGMVTMVQDGLLKALDGITSVEEIFRVAK